MLLSRSTFSCPALSAPKSSRAVPLAAPLKGRRAVNDRQPLKANLLRQCPGGVSGGALSIKGYLARIEG
jgi:hypothetical protein